MLEHHVMPLRRQHPNVIRREVCLITIAMMHHFTRLELTFKKLLGKQPMNAHSFPVTPRSRIRIQRLGHGLFYSNHAEIPDTQNQNSTLER